MYARVTASRPGCCFPASRLGRKTQRMTGRELQIRADAVATSYRRPEAWVQENKAVNLVVLGPKLPEFEEGVVEGLASVATIKGRGVFPADFDHLTDKEWEEVEVLFITTFSNEGLEGAFRKAKNLKWIHTFSAGLNQLVLPSILESNIPVTNAKGVYSHSLAEYALFACNYFAKDLPRLLKSKSERKWDVFAVQELRGRTMGIVGLGDIGKATATIAKAFKMKVIGVRRNTTLSESEKQIIDEVYGPEELAKMMGMSDYVVAALPQTEKTVELINAAAINAMQPHAVFVNIGRGKTVEEPALIKALQEKRIKGAALDVYYDEPLSPESEFYGLDNVLMSYHNADKTDHSVSDSIELFKEILEEYIDGQELRNLVDVRAGY